DRWTVTTARAYGGLDAAEAQPRRCEPWRSRGRRWSGHPGPLDRTTLPLSAVGAAARSRRRAGPGWQRRLCPWARRGSALRTATDPRRRGDAGRGSARSVGVSRRGLPGGDAVSVAAQAGPPTAALPASLLLTRPARQQPHAPRRYGTYGHDATTPPRTGGQRQRSGELSTISGENRSHQETNCRRS